MPDIHKYYQVGVNVMSGIDIPKNSSIQFRDKNLNEDDYEKIQFSFDVHLGFNLKKYPLTLYGGLIRTNLGGGIVYRFSDRINVGFMTRAVSDEENFDNEINSSIDVRYRFWKNLQLYTGINNISGDEEYIAGIKYLYFDKDIKYLIGAMSLR
jgi:hypothetical protein